MQQEEKINTSNKEIDFLQQQFWAKYERLNEKCEKSFSNNKYNETIKIAKRVLLLEKAIGYSLEFQNHLSIPHLNIGKSYVSLGRFLRGLVHLNKAIKYDDDFKNFFQVNYYLGLVYQKYPQYGSAIKMFKSIVEEKPKEAIELDWFNISLYNLMLSLVEEKNYFEAQIYLNIALKNNELDDFYLLQFNHYMGYVKYQLGCIEESLKFYNRALQYTDDLKTVFRIRHALSTIKIIQLEYYSALYQLIKVYPAFFDKGLRPKFIKQFVKILKHIVPFFSTIY